LDLLALLLDQGPQGGLVLLGTAEPGCGQQQQAGAQEDRADLPVFPPKHGVYLLSCRAAAGSGRCPACSSSTTSLSGNTQHSSFFSSFFSSFLTRRSVKPQPSSTSVTHCPAVGL